jgi:hypothetical protein
MSKQALQEKWNPILEHADLPEIQGDYRKSVTAVLLENTQKALNEDRRMLNEAEVGGSSIGVAANYDPILIGLVRRAMPQLIAYDICGVQPMTGPTGLIFAMKSTYVDNAARASRSEALFNEANSAWSGSGAQTGTNPVDTGDNGLDPWASNAPGNFSKGAPVALTDDATTDPQTWGAATGLTMNQMSFKIEKMAVEAKSRALKAEYTMELQQDLKAIHGLDAEQELTNILSNEIIAEINREVIRTIYTVAQTGAELTASPGTFDLDVDANGRWSVERFKGMLFQIERDANRIAQTTRRGKGNFILCSSDVASALAMAGKLDYAPALSTNLNVDESTSTFAGVLNGRYKVYVDPYLANGSSSQFMMVGYRGSSPFDAGLFYAPYVPLQLMRAVDPETFQPKIGFKTRYGMVNHPMAVSTVGSTPTLSARSNNYFRLMRVTNLA